MLNNQRSLKVLNVNSAMVQASLVRILQPALHGCLHALPGVLYPLSVHALLSEATNDKAVGFALLSTPLGNHH